MPTANLSETGVLNALLSKGKVNDLVNLLTLRATSKALKTAIDSRKNLVNKNKIKVLKIKQEQLRPLVGRRARARALATSPQNINFGMKHKDFFRIGKIVSKYFKGYNERPNPNGVPTQVQVYKMPSGQRVNFPMRGKIFHARDAYEAAQRMKRYKKTILRKNGNRIYFEVPNRGRFVFNKRTSELHYDPIRPGFSLQSGVKLSNIFSKSNRKKIKSLHE